MFYRSDADIAYEDLLSHMTMTIDSIFVAQFETMRSKPDSVNRFFQFFGRLLRLIISDPHVKTLCLPTADWTTLKEVIRPHLEGTELFNSLFGNFDVNETKGYLVGYVRSLIAPMKNDLPISLDKIAAAQKKINDEVRRQCIDKRYDGPQTAKVNYLIKEMDMPAVSFHQVLMYPFWAFVRSLGLGNSVPNQEYEVDLLPVKWRTEPYIEVLH